MTEKISLVLCVYNAEKYLKECFVSIEQQSLRPHQVVIVNDGSTDRSQYIIKEFIESSSIPVTYIDHQNKGLTKSLNVALMHCTGDYVARMDADDIACPERLKRSLRFMQVNQVDLMCARAQRFRTCDGELDKVPRISNDLQDVSLELLKFGNPFIHGSFFFKRSILNKIKYNEAYRTAQDYELLCQLLTQGYKVGYSSEVLYKLRIDPESSGRKKGSSQVENAKNIAKFYFGTDKFLIVKYKGVLRILLSVFKRIYY